MNSAVMDMLAFTREMTAALRERVRGREVGEAIVDLMGASLRVHHSPDDPEALDAYMEAFETLDDLVWPHALLDDEVYQALWAGRGARANVRGLQYRLRLLPLRDPSTRGNILRELLIEQTYATASMVLMFAEAALGTGLLSQAASDVLKAVEETGEAIALGCGAVPSGAVEEALFHAEATALSALRACNELCGSECANSRDFACAMLRTSECAITVTVAMQPK